MPIASETEMTDDGCEWEGSNCGVSVLLAGLRAMAWDRLRQTGDGRG